MRKTMPRRRQLPIGYEVNNGDVLLGAVVIGLVMAGLVGGLVWWMH